MIILPLYFTYKFLVECFLMFSWKYLYVFIFVFISLHFPDHILHLLLRVKWLRNQKHINSKFPLEVSAGAIVVQPERKKADWCKCNRTVFVISTVLYFWNVKLCHCYFKKLCLPDLSNMNILTLMNVNVTISSFLVGYLLKSFYNVCI